MKNRWLSKRIFDCLLASRQKYFASPSTIVKGEAEGRQLSRYTMIHEIIQFPLTLAYEKFTNLHGCFRLEGCKKSNLRSDITAWAMIHMDFPRDCPSRSTCKRVFVYRFSQIEPLGRMVRAITSEIHKTPIQYEGINILQALARLAHLEKIFLFLHKTGQWI